VYIGRVCRPLRPAAACCGFHNFKDTQFPPDASSLGAWQDKTPAEIEKAVSWVRCGDLFPKHADAKGYGNGDCTHKDTCYLFEGKIEPADIDQGQLGDCWLMTAFASLAQFSPASIINLFVTREYNPGGKYIIKLFNPEKEKWVRITVDDYIPCAKGMWKRAAR